MEIFYITLSLLFPAAVIYLTYRYKVFNTIGAVLLCYFGGIIAGNIGILPESLTPLKSSLSEVTVALSLPLLLFSMDVKSWFKIAGKAILSMLLATIAVVAVSTAAFFMVRHGGNKDAYKLAGMAIGVYTGGTPNLASIKAALNIDSSSYILFHTYDTVFSLLYIFFIVSVGQRFFNKFLIPFKKSAAGLTAGSFAYEGESVNEYRGIFSPRILLPLLGAFLLTGAVIAVSVTIGSYFPADRNAAVTILSITTLSIILSFIGKVRNIKKTFQAGMYIIYIFCFVVASMTDMRNLVHINYTILFFVSFSIFGSMALHALMCRIAGIDTDTFLVTSVSAICSPPFVPVVAGALKNPAVLLSGITTGIIGYAVGNYLGISLAMILQSLH